MPGTTVPVSTGVHGSSTRGRGGADARAGRGGGGGSAMDCAAARDSAVAAAAAASWAESGIAPAVSAGVLRLPRKGILSQAVRLRATALAARTVGHFIESL